MSETAAVILVLAIFAGGIWMVGIMLGATLIVIEDLWLRVRRPIKVGAKWEYDSKNPFTRIVPVTITGAKKGYVEYKECYTGRVSSERAESFRRHYRPASNAP